MDDSLKKLKKLSEMMKKQGILVYKTPEIELQLSPSAISLESSEPETNKPLKTEELTPEQILLWSAPGSESDLPESVN